MFSLIGLQLPTLIRALPRAEAWPAEALTVTGTLIVIRILWVLPLSAIIQRRGGARRPSWPVPAVVIVISLIVQGLTLEPLVRRAGVARPAGRHEETVARLRLAEAALARLDELAAGESMWLAMTHARQRDQRPAEGGGAAEEPEDNRVSAGC